VTVFYVAHVMELISFVIIFNYFSVAGSPATKLTIN